jgi:hypothetical protein
LLQYNNSDDKNEGIDDDDPATLDDLSRVIDVVHFTPTKNDNQAPPHASMPRFSGAGASEITITPNYKTAMATSTPATGHMILDNDVMVDYDPPMIDGTSTMSTSMGQHQHHRQNQHQKQHLLQQKQKDGPPVDMTKVLKANPQISMRELFPGEEELGLQMNVPFNSFSMRTPEGWTRVSTNLQYDDTTRTLWEELQKPYGNQSSFLRHLILLERYYRNGDLVLSSNASTSALSYSESVQNRLRSYDNVLPLPTQKPQPTSSQQTMPTPTATTSAAAVQNQNDEETNNILRQMSNSSITIFPTTKAKSKPPQAQQPSVGEQPKQQSILMQQRKPEKTSKVDKESVGPPSKIPRLDEMTITPSTSSNSPPKRNNTSPPSGATTPDVISVKPKDGGSGKKESGSNDTATKKPSSAPLASTSPAVIQLPDSLSEKERIKTAKPWRPTLIPITPGSVKAAMKGPLYQTADGRKLPALVQVMSGGKPYHISIHDYNRMCILRREKLLQQQQHQQIQQQQQHYMQYQQNMQQLQQMQQNQQQMSKRQTPPNMPSHQQQHQQQRMQHEENSALAVAKMNLLIASQQMQQQNQFQHQHPTPPNTTHTSTSSTNTPSAITKPSAGPPAPPPPPPPLPPHSPRSQILDPEIPVNVIQKSLYMNNNSASRNPTLGHGHNSVSNELSINSGSGMSVTTKGGKNKNQSTLKNFTAKSLHLPNSTSVLPLPPGPPSSSGSSIIHHPSHYAPFPPSSGPNALMQLSAMTGHQPQNPYSLQPPGPPQNHQQNNHSAMEALIKSQQQQHAQNNMWLWHENSALGNHSGNSGNNSANINSGGSMLMDNNAASLLSKIPKSLTVIPQQKSRSQRTSSNDERHHSH